VHLVGFIIRKERRTVPFCKAQKHSITLNEKQSLTGLWVFSAVAGDRGIRSCLLHVTLVHWNQSQKVECVLLTSVIVEGRYLELWDLRCHDDSVLKLDFWLVTPTSFAPVLWTVVLIAYSGMWRQHWLAYEKVSILWTENKWHVVENRTEIKQHVLKMQ